MNKKILVLLLLVFTSALVLSACSLLKSNGSAASDPNLLFADDFSDTSSGWDRASGDEGFTDYQDGTYHIRVDVEKYDLWANPGKSFADVSMQVDATLVNGTEDNDFGLLCRYQDTENYYFAEVASDGYYGLGKVIGGKQYMLGDGKFASTDLVNAGNTLNHLQLDCVGGTMTLYINGTLAGSATDTDFTSGDVGLIAGTFNTAGVEIEFDNFKVSNP